MCRVCVHCVCVCGVALSVCLSGVCVCGVCGVVVVFVWLCGVCVSVV